jgi:hypothetical protein
MRELIHEKPRDVIQYLEEEGVIKVRWSGRLFGDFHVLQIHDTLLLV